MCATGCRARRPCSGKWPEAVHAAWAERTDDSGLPAKPDGFAGSPLWAAGRSAAVHLALDVLVGEVADLRGVLGGGLDGGAEVLAAPQAALTAVPGEIR